MSRASQVFIGALAAFLLFLFVWAVRTNLREKGERHEADREAWEARLQPTPDSAGQAEIPLPPVVMAEFRRTVRAAFAEPGSEGTDADNAADGDSNELKATIEAAKESALKGAAERMTDPEPYKGGWKQILDAEEEKLRKDAELDRQLGRSSGEL